ERTRVHVDLQRGDIRRPLFRDRFAEELRCSITARLEARAVHRGDALLAVEHEYQFAQRIEDRCGFHWQTQHSRTTTVTRSITTRSISPRPNRACGMRTRCQSNAVGCCPNILTVCHLPDVTDCVFR